MVKHSGKIAPQECFSSQPQAPACVGATPKPGNEATKADLPTGALNHSPNPVYNLDGPCYSKDRIPGSSTSSRTLKKPLPSNTTVHRHPLSLQNSASRSKESSLANYLCERRVHSSHQHPCPSQQHGISHGILPKQQKLSTNFSVYESPSYKTL